jgi:hypothetical protein
VKRAVIAELEAFVLQHHNSRRDDAPKRVKASAEAGGHTVRAVATRADCRSVSRGALRKPHYTVRWYLDDRVVSRANLIKALEVAA